MDTKKIIDNIFLIKSKKLTTEQFQSFGVIVKNPDVPAPKQGNDWDCWNQLAHLGLVNPTVGIVKTRPCTMTIVAMERYHKQEILIPITGPIIQTLVLAGDNNSLKDQPSATNAKALIIFPGEAVIIKLGIWHCAAFPLEKQEIFYFYLTEPSSGHVSFGGWVNFENNESISLDNGENEWM